MAKKCIYLLWKDGSFRNNALERTKVVSVVASKDIRLVIVGSKEANVERNKQRIKM